MRLEEAVDAIEACRSLQELKERLHGIVQDHGFASFGFVDIGSPEVDKPFWMATSDEQWNVDYEGNNFLLADPVIPVARRTNTPFKWSDVTLPLRRGKRKPASHGVMDAARDHGLTEGLVVPFHFVDKLGRLNSASCVLYWKDRQSLFNRVPRQSKAELHVIMIYWIQRVMEVMTLELGRRQRGGVVDLEAGRMQLTDRERLILQWAARGKTVAETATILSITGNTVETHMRSAMEKLDATNKTHAAVKAIKLGIIDV